MSDTTKPDSDHPDPTTDRTLLNESKSTVTLSESDTRTLAVKLFAVAGGGFVVDIEFRSSNANIPAVAETERVDTVQDVEDILCLFDPMAHMTVHSDRSRLPHADAMKRVSRMTMNAYDAVTEETVSAARAHLKENPDCEFVLQREQKRVNRLWKLLGMQ